MKADRVTLKSLTADVRDLEQRIYNAECELNEVNQGRWRFSMPSLPRPKVIMIIALVAAAVNYGMRYL